MKQLFFALLTLTAFSSLFSLQKETIFSAASAFCDDYTSKLSSEDQKVLLRYITQRRTIAKKRRKRLAKLNEIFNNTKVLDLTSAQLKLKTFLKIYTFSFKLDKKLARFDAVWNDIFHTRSPELNKVHQKLIEFESHIPKPTSFFFNKLLQQTRFYCKKKKYYLSKCLRIVSANLETLDTQKEEFNAQPYWTLEQPAEQNDRKDELNSL